MWASSHFKNSHLQVHTTGMDIKQVLNAKAFQTLGKDMTFRDFAQGAFRMRGVGQGQTITLLIIPEVQKNSVAVLLWDFLVVSC